MAPIPGPPQEKAQQPPPSSNSDPSPPPEDTTLGNSITLPDIPPLPKINPWFIVSVVVIIVLICVLAGLGFVAWRWYSDWRRRPLRRKEAWEVEVFGCGGCGREPSRSVTPESTARNTSNQEIGQSNKEAEAMTCEKELSISGSVISSEAPTFVEKESGAERSHNSFNDRIRAGSTKVEASEATLAVPDLPPRLDEPDWNRLTLVTAGFERELGFDIRSSGQESIGLEWQNHLQVRPETEEEQIQRKVIDQVAHC
ncbi:MAG: hypothetical protein M1831_003217 [Alyxoria varia]|nr:MAG: hypothetical protein M1831_003217 [Alyxoria varia]